MPFLKVKNLSQTISGHKILKDIHFEIEKGEVVALLGPNGAGKTTFLRTVMGLNPNPELDVQNLNNTICLDNQNINDWAVSKRVESGLLYLPQQTSLFRSMTVLQNLKLVYEYHSYWKKENNFSNFCFEMEKWLENTGLSQSVNQNAGVLSGGQKRKLEVVRSILMHPSIIMLDEPFAGVDPKSIYELKKIFLDMAKEGIAVLISDHNVDQLLSISNRAYVIIGGQVVTSGSIKDIINNNYTKEIYFGKQFSNEISERFL